MKPIIYSSLRNIVNNKQNVKLLPIKSSNIAVTTNYLINPNLYKFRMWKTDTIFNIPLDKINYKTNYIGALDYQINKDNIFIEFINGIDNEQYKKLNLSDYNLTNHNYIQNILLEIIEIKAKKNNIKKIKMDVHSNLFRYHSEFFEHGFELTGQNSDFYPYWVKIEKNIY
jgi:hypothetical protein